MELERTERTRASAELEPETVVIGAGIGEAEWRALRAFQSEVEGATRTYWLEVAGVDGAIARARLLDDRCSACVGLVGAALGEREIVRFVRTLAGPERLSPVIVLAGRDDEDLVTAALAAGACDYVLVPELDADRLVRSIRLAAEVARHARAVERWRAGQRDLEARFDAVWELIEDGLLLVDDQRIIRRSNRAARRLLGLSDAELSGAPFGSLRWGNSGDGPGDLAAHSARELAAEFERPDGSRIRLGVRVRAYNQRSAPAGPGGRMRIVVLRDRNETDEHANLLAEARHFAGLGRLLAGAAHDGNNLLTPLLGYSDLLLAALPRGSDTERYAMEIERSARRAAELLRRLLEHSRGRPLDLRPVVADQALAEITGLLRSLVGSGIELEVRLGAPGLAVSLREGEMEQLVLNLAANARDAMPGGGKLELRTTSEGGRGFALELEDNGVGIPGENLERVFDPSFTTKAVGKGTGLGLWIVRSIVQESGGRVRISSRPGEGTTVRIELPAVAPGEAQTVLER